MKWNGLTPIYKEKTSIGAICSKCDKYTQTSIWIGFDDGTEAPFGPRCAEEIMPGKGKEPK